MSDYELREAINSVDARKALDEFLVGNDELEKLTARLSTFNMFRVLHIEDVEIRHSNVLAWLLNPRESHGLGEAFLRRLISTVLLNKGSGLKIDLTPARVELMDLVDAEVWREWQNIDLLVFSATGRWIILIENKVKAKESKDQLRRYLETVRRQFPNFKVAPIFLTLEGDEPSEVAQKAGFISWSYVQLYQVAKQVIDQRQDRIPEDAKVFLAHYLDMLRRQTMQDEELIELCKSIYGKHKAAINLIVAWGAVSQFSQVVEAFVQTKPELYRLATMTNAVWFLPRAWTELMPELSLGWTSSYPVAIRIVNRPKRSRVGIIMEIGPMPDSKQRIKLVKAFNDAGFKITKGSFEEDARYTRVYSEYPRLQNIDDPDEIRAAINDLWRKSEKKIDEATKLIRNFSWT